VGVAHGLGQGGVPEDLLERRQVARRHHEVAGEGVPEIVEPEGLERFPFPRLKSRYSCVTSAKVLGAAGAGGESRSSRRASLFACGLDPVVVDCDDTGARVADPIHSP
jgi:hypothetical protein